MARTQVRKGRRAEPGFASFEHANVAVQLSREGYGVRARLTWLVALAAMQGVQPSGTALHNCGTSLVASRCSAADPQPKPAHRMDRSTGSAPGCAFEMLWSDSGFRRLHMASSCKLWQTVVRSKRAEAS